MRCSARTRGTAGITRPTSRGSASGRAGTDAWNGAWREPARAVARARAGLRRERVREVRALLGRFGARGGIHGRGIVVGGDRQRRRGRAGDSRASLPEDGTLDRLSGARAPDPLGTGAARHVARGAPHARAVTARLPARPWRARRLSLSRFGGARTRRFVAGHGEVRARPAGTND